MSSLLPQFDGATIMQTMVCLLFANTPKGRGVPAVVVGDPGTAKSAYNEALFSQLGLVHRTISPGLKGEAFFGVSPVPTESAGDIGQKVMSFPPARVAAAPHQCPRIGAVHRRDERRGQLGAAAGHARGAAGPHDR